jgi:hypothetical protein
MSACRGSASHPANGERRTGSRGRAHVCLPGSASPPACRGSASPPACRGRSSNGNDRQRLALRPPDRPPLTEGLEGFNEAVKQLEAARVQDSVLATRLANAVEAWDRRVEKTYGALVVELGRARADGFFPRVGGRRKKGPEPPSPVTDTHGWAPTLSRIVIPGPGKPSARFKAGGRWPGASVLTRKGPRPGARGSDLRPSRTFPSGSGRESSTRKRPRRGRGATPCRVPNDRPRQVPRTAARPSRLGCLVDPGLLA